MTRFPRWGNLMKNRVNFSINFWFAFFTFLCVLKFSLCWSSVIKARLALTRVYYLVLKMASLTLFMFWFYNIGVFFTFIKLQHLCYSIAINQNFFIMWSGYLWNNYFYTYISCANYIFYNDNFYRHNWNWVL